MYRLALPAALLVASSACGWLAGTATSPTNPDGTPAAPVVDGPTCRPKEADARGAPPWKVGDATPSGWAVTAVDVSHMEYVRVTFTKAEVSTTLELAYNEAGAGDWATERYKLMPAPDATPPEELLNEAITHLRAFAAAEVGDPFVKRSEGVIDPFEGLPPCP